MVCQTILTLILEHDDLPMTGRYPVLAALGMINIVWGAHLPNDPDAYPGRRRRADGRASSRCCCRD